MKTIIMTINPVHLGNIRSGKKTAELRKNCPVAFPVRVLLCESGSGGQIKAEFTCETVLHTNYTPGNMEEILCLTSKEIWDYLGNKNGYIWKISNMIDYCSTKGYRVRNISEFGLKRPPQSWQYVPDERKAVERDGDLIYREELRRRIEYQRYLLRHGRNRITVAMVEQQINGMPAVDAEPVRHAYWIGSDAYGDADGFPVYDTFECSECHDWYDNCDGTPPPHNYCPNCGAKMDGNGERKTEK